VLFQNYPNPFNPTTTIVFRLTTSGFTSLRVFDLMRREVSTLVSEQMQPGIIGWSGMPLPLRVEHISAQCSASLRQAPVVQLSWRRK
jgi:hypothetical protein